MKMPCALAALLLLFLPSCEKKSDTVEGPLLQQEDRDYIARSMEEARQEVRLVLFTGDGQCEHCDSAERILDEIAFESSLISVEKLSLKDGAARAAELGIDRPPGIAILGGVDYGLRYFGFPTGYEFTTFVEAVRMAAAEDPSLEPETAEKVAALPGPVRITVFSTKT